MTTMPDWPIHPIKMIITIVDRGRGKDVVKLFHLHGLHFQLISLGHGTADSHILDYFGLGETEKDVVFSFAPQEMVKKVMDALSEGLQLDKPGHGISFSLPISSVGGMVVLQRLLGELAKEEKGHEQPKEV